MSASIRIKILGGTDLEAAYFDCQSVSYNTGGIAVATNFNGVEMFYHHQSLEEWKDEYHKCVYGAAKEGGAK